MFGPAAELCAQLAAAEINAADGVLGRELRLHTVDSAGPINEVAGAVAELVRASEIDSVVGWHLSDLRRTLAPLISNQVPYIYTALYEGGERTDGVWLTGEVPQRQVLPGVGWLCEQTGAHRWCVVGNDYIWPRATSAQFRRYAANSGIDVIGQYFVQLGTTDYEEVVRRIGQHNADAVLVLLVGEDAAHFNRSFAASGLDDRCARLSPLMDENMIMASGAENTKGLYSVAGFFENIATTDSKEFLLSYARAYGPDAPIPNSASESCYEGIRLFDALTRAAQSYAVGDICGVSEGIEFHGARGDLHLENSHADQPIYLAKADELSVNVLTDF